MGLTPSLLLWTMSLNILVFFNVTPKRVHSPPLSPNKNIPPIFIVFDTFPKNCYTCFTKHRLNTLQYTAVCRTLYCTLNCTLLLYTRLYILLYTWLYTGQPPHPEIQRFQPFLQGKVANDILQGNNLFSSESHT